MTREEELQKVLFYGHPNNGSFAALHFDITIFEHRLTVRDGVGRAEIRLPESDLRRLLAIVQRELASFDKPTD